LEPVLTVATAAVATAAAVAATAITAAAAIAAAPVAAAPVAAAHVTGPVSGGRSTESTSYVARTFLSHVALHLVFARLANALFLIVVMVLGQERVGGVCPWIVVRCKCWRAHQCGNSNCQ
jgi:hypothetical protein